MKRVLPIIVVLVLIKVRMLSAAPAPVPEVTGLAPSPTKRVVVVVEETSWEHMFLSRVGNASPTLEMLAFVNAWVRAEGTDAVYNPLATSQDMPGATTFNSDGVKNYLTLEDGVDAAAITLTYDYPGYAEILAGLQTNDVERAFNGLKASPWGTHSDNVALIYNEWVGVETADVAAAAPTPPSAVGNKCPYTDTMEYDHDNGGFYASAPVWGSQYGGWHNGVDFTGAEGDWVYAPFDLTVDPEGTGVGFYGDSARYGGYIQGHFNHDGVLFYSGHLISVAVEPGQFVPACSPIGQLGATTYKHTHIKLGGPRAPIPCESSEPGWNTGCLDPIEYWNTH